MADVECTDGGKAADDRLTLSELGSVRDGLTAPGLVGFQVNEQQLGHSSGAKIGKAPPPPPPAPPRI